MYNSLGLDTNWYKCTTVWDWTLTGTNVQQSGTGQTFNAAVTSAVSIKKYNNKTGVVNRSKPITKGF